MQCVIPSLVSRRGNLILLKAVPVQGKGDHEVVEGLSYISNIGAS